MTSETCMKSFQIQFPFAFIKEALKSVEGDENFVLKRKGILPTLQKEVNITFTSVKAHLNLTFEKLPFPSSDGTFMCIINSTEDDPNQNATDTNGDLEKSVQQNNEILKTTNPLEPAFSGHHTSTSEEKTQDRIQQSEVLQGNILNSDPSLTLPDSSPVPVKRKRGRPKKVKCSQSLETGGTDAHDVKNENPTGLNNTFTSKSIGEKNDTVVDTLSPNLENNENIVNSSSKSNQEENCSGKRYGLRGRKLNPKVMALVKSSGIDGDESGDEFVTHSDSGSDDEISRDNVKMKNNVKRASKENKTFSKKIKEQIKEILSKGAVLDIIKQTRGGLVDCEICRKKLYGYAATYRHVFKMHKKSAAREDYLEKLSKLKECSCCFCGETFIDNLSLNNHKENAHKHLSFPCPLCNYKSKNVSNLKMHIRNMHIEVGKQAFCHLCTASFRSQGSLKQHIDLNHHGNKHVKCDICKKQFYNNSQLRRHMKAHGSNLNKRFACKLCGKVFNFEYNLKRHISAIHQPQSESFHCSYCGKGFSQKVPMITHVQHVHFNIFPYSCKECKHSFLKAPLLKEHMLSVHHITDYEVLVTPKNSVYDKGDEDKFYCSYCSKCFAHKIRLIEHVHGDHADAFPYKCDTCVQGFLEYSYLKLHKLKAHGEMLQNDNILANAPNSAGEIMQIITTKKGHPKKVMSAISGTEIFAESEETIQESQSVVMTENTDSQNNFATNMVETVQSTSSLLVEVEQGSNTYQYVIEAPESMGSSEFAMQDIADLLIAAGKTVDEDQVKVLDGTPSSVQTISLVVDENGQSHISTNENQAQPMEILLGQNGQNISLVSADNQGQPMEVVIDQNSEVLTSENQAQLPLQMEHGDIIEMNDSNSIDGKNYYQIINVLEDNST